MGQYFSYHYWWSGTEQPKMVLKGVWSSNNYEDYGIIKVIPSGNKIQVEINYEETEWTSRFDERQTRCELTSTDGINFEGIFIEDEGYEPQKMVITCSEPLTSFTTTLQGMYECENPRDKGVFMLCSISNKHGSMV